jgi:anti-anti-sigma factor
LKGGQQLVDLVVSLGDVPHPDFAVQAIVAATADPLAIGIARLDELGNALLTCSQLVVDLSTVQFIDSSTIHCLIRMKREADDKRCDFRLVLNGDAPNIEHTLEICGVLGVLNRVATVDAALEHVGSGTPMRRRGVVPA